MKVNQPPAFACDACRHMKSDADAFVKIQGAYLCKDTHLLFKQHCGRCSQPNDIKIKFQTALYVGP